MARLHSILTASLLATLPVALGGCAGALVVGGIAAAGGAGYAAGQERGVNGVATDFTIKNDIANAFTAANPALQLAVTTEVYQGRVLLTGRVSNEAMRASAVQIAGRIHDVRAVYDEIAVAPAEAFWDDTKDSWITAQVRAQMAVDPGVRSVNYTIDTENGSVFLIGSARSQGELDRATRIARYVPGVRRVVSYVEIRGGSPVAAMPAAAGSATGFDAPPASAAPPAGIEVQKL